MNDLLDLIRLAPLDRLRDVAYVEHELLPALGLNPEAIGSYPADLHRYFGGLKSWQFPIQLAPYLVDMSTRNVRRYLEIGVRHGGTFIITVEYLKRFNPVVMAVAVDPYRSPQLAAYIEGDPLTCRYVNIDSQSEAARRLVARLGPFDLAFIDGDHSEAGFLNDWRLVKDWARIVAAHDVDNDGYPWIREFWRGLDGGATGFFTDFYPEIERRHGGIGVDYAPL